MSITKQIHKKMGWKKKAKAFEAALAVELKNKAKINGLLGVLIYIFGEDVMKSIVEFQNNPTEDNKKQVRNKLELHFMQINEES